MVELSRKGKSLLAQHFRNIKGTHTSFNRICLLLLFKHETVPSFCMQSSSFAKFDSSAAFLFLRNHVLFFYIHSKFFSRALLEHHGNAEFKNDIYLLNFIVEFSWVFTLLIFFTSGFFFSFSFFLIIFL